MEHIPMKLGGQYSYDQEFSNFVRMRLSVEDIMSGARLRVQNDISPPMRRMIRVQREADETESDFSRRRNNIYGQRVRQRRENELTSLIQQRDLLKLQKDILQEENSRLESCLIQAQSLVLDYHVQQHPELSCE